jgi:hypothetical protein
MKQDVKIDVRRKARMIRGTINLLVDDASYICSDADDFDLVGLRESIPEAKETVEKLIDHIADLEYAVYLSTNEGPSS